MSQTTAENGRETEESADRRDELLDFLCEIKTFYRQKKGIPFLDFIIRKLVSCRKNKKFLCWVLVWISHLRSEVVELIKNEAVLRGCKNWLKSWDLEQKNLFPWHCLQCFVSGRMTKKVHWSMLHSFSCLLVQLKLFSRRHKELVNRFHHRSLSDRMARSLRTAFT